MSIGLPIITSPIPLCTTTYMCLIPMTLSLAHEHSPSTKGLLRILFLLILRVLGILEFCKLTHGFPALTQIFMGHLLFLWKIFACTTSLHDPWSITPIIWTVHPPLTFHFAVQEKTTSTLNRTVLFCFALHKCLSLRQKLVSIFFGKQHLNE